MARISKRTLWRLRHDISTLQEFVNRYGDITLWDAYDRVAVELDYRRGSCVKRKRHLDTTSKLTNEEYLSWI